MNRASLGAATDQHAGCRSGETRRKAHSPSLELVPCPLNPTTSPPLAALVLPLYPVLESVHNATMTEKALPSRESARERKAGLAWDRGLRTILDSINDGVFTVDSEFKVTSFNRAAATITGTSEEEAVGRPCWEVFKADICEGSCALKRTLATGRPVINQSVRILNSKAQKVPISVSTALLKDAKGHVVGGVETFRDLSLVEDLRRQVEKRFAFQDMLSAHHKMREIFELLPQVAESDCTVLITGESGTGKELMARALHHLSPRASGPLVVVNCGALPDALLESELFGYRAGAFTDAKRDKLGRLSAAQGGTLFLDEVGDVSPAMQVRLLRVLQEKTFEPLGSNRTLHADVRFLAATNKNLLAEVRAGRFREDLYYRLNVVQIAIPPLRDRREDISLLAMHVLDKLNHLRGRDIQGFTPEAMRCLLRYPWPGNIRELENSVEHAFILCRQGLVLPEHLPAAVCAESGPPAPGEAPLGAGNLREMESAHMLSVLDRHKGNRSAAARELGIHKTTLWRRLRKGTPPHPS